MKTNTCEVLVLFSAELLPSIHSRTRGRSPPSLLCCCSFLTSKGKVRAAFSTRPLLCVSDLNISEPMACLTRGRHVLLFLRARRLHDPVPRAAAPDHIGFWKVRFDAPPSAPAAPSHKNEAMLFRNPLIYQTMEHLPFPSMHC